MFTAGNVFFFSSFTLCGWNRKEGCFDTADVSAATHKAVSHGSSQVQTASLDVPGNTCYWGLHQHLFVFTLQREFTRTLHSFQEKPPQSTKDLKCFVISPWVVLLNTSKVGLPQFRAMVVVTQLIICKEKLWMETTQLTLLQEFHTKVCFYMWELGYTECKSFYHDKAEI